MASNGKYRTVETVERSITKITKADGTVQYRVDKRFGGGYSENRKRYVEKFDTLEEAREHLKEVLETQHKDRKWRSYVYFFKNLDTGHIKIGKATNPKARFASVNATMKTSRILYGEEPSNLEILGWIEQSLELNEDSLHLKFRKHRTSGEWFDGEIEKEVEKILNSRKSFKP